MLQANWSTACPSGVYGTRIPSVLLVRMPLVNQSFGSIVLTSSAGQGLMLSTGCIQVQGGGLATSGGYSLDIECIMLATWHVCA